MTTLNNTSINYRLFAGLTEEDKKLIEKYYELSKPLIDRLVSIFKKDLEKSTKEGDDFSKFESPNWELVQAFLAGQREALRTIINLLVKER